MMMGSIASELFGTIVLRPYVFVFLLIYLIGCSLHMGFTRALLFGIAGYLIAWLSELSSIHNGFPYGYYYYIESTAGKEIWVLGVPLMDSISYVFLAYASYSLALLVLSPVRRLGSTFYILETRKIRVSFLARLLGATFIVFLDIIIDPVALRGDRWFLGRIYGYPEQGIYFGVPLSNFIGWFLVGFIMIYALQKLDQYLQKKESRDFAGYRYRWRHMIGPALYFGVLVFNLSMTFIIKEYTLGLVGIVIVLLSALFIYILRRNKLSSKDPEQALTAHREDFPLAVIE